MTDPAFQRPASTCCAQRPIPVEPAPGESCCGSKGAKASQTAPVTSKAASGWKAYTPLFVILACVSLSTAALQVAASPVERSWMLAMSQFMGLFLVVFSMLKLFDLSGFVEGFARYDLAAGAVRGYGYLYPFLELGLGLALLARFRPFEVNALLAALMFFGAVGVLRSLRRGEKLRCACMGSSLNVPLSTVAVVEDLGMGLMSLVMLGMLS